MVLALARPTIARAQSSALSPNGELRDEPRDATPARPLVDIRMEPAVAGEDPWQRVALARLTPLTDAIVRVAIERAVNSGTFADVRASTLQTAEGTVLILRGERRFRLNEVRFEGVEDRPIDAVRADWELAGERWTTERALEAARARLEQAYRSAGWQSARVAARFVSTRDIDTRTVILQVTEGLPTRIRSVILQGTSIDRTLAGRLCDALVFRVSASDDGVAGCAPPVGTIDIIEPRAVRTLVERVGTALSNDGYYAHRFESAVPVPVRGNSLRVDLQIPVVLGHRYRLQFRGIAESSQGSLREALRLEDEHSMDDATAQVLATRARDWYVRRGFADARVSVAIFEESRTQARIELTARPGTPVFVRSVAFVGSRFFTYQTLREMLNELLRSEVPGGSLVVAPTEAEMHLSDGSDSTTSTRTRAPFALQPERVYVQEVYQELARRIVGRYRENGFLDARVVLTTPPVRERDEIGRPVFAVTFAVTEGERVALDALEFEGNTAVSSAELAREAALRLGGPIDLSELSSVRERLIEMYRELGYNYVRIATNVDRSPNGAHARVRVSITEGSLVRVARVEIRGLRSLPRELVYDRLALRERDVYRPSEARESQRRLGELGYFSSITVALADPDVEASAKTLLVQLSEAGGAFETRGGMSILEPARASVQYGRRNLFATGMSFNASVQAGYVYPVVGYDQFRDTLNSLEHYRRIRGRVSVSIQTPPFRALAMDFRPTFDLSALRSIEQQFAITGLEFSPSLTLRPQRGLTLTALGNVQLENLEIFRAQSIVRILMDSTPAEQLRLGRLLLLPAGLTGLASAKVTVSLDRRDQVFNPQRGFFLSSSLEFVGVFAFIEQVLMDAMTTHQTPPGNTVRSTVSFSLYGSPRIGVLGTWTAALNVRLGANFTVDPCNRVTFPNRQFFLGGADSLRGWLQDSVIPADVLAPPPTSGCANIPPGEPPTSTVFVTQRGADAFVLARGELRIPLGSLGIALDVFVDVGNLWKDLRHVFSRFTLRYSPGIGVRYISPIGPVGIDIGFNVAPTVITAGGTTISSEPPVVLSFSIGSV